MYGLSGKMTAHPGQRDALIAILLDGMNSNQAPEGCYAYIVGTIQADPDAIWITEVWRSQDDHRASLSNETVKAAIAAGRPLIAGMSDDVEFTPVGGVGLPDSTER
jgi:quinol monooxygenase YgiN